MKKVKGLLCIVLVFVMIMGVCGCSSTEKDEPHKTEEKDEPHKTEVRVCAQKNCSNNCYNNDTQYCWEHSNIGGYLVSFEEARSIVSSKSFFDSVEDISPEDYSVAFIAQDFAQKYPTILSIQPGSKFISITGNFKSIRDELMVLDYFFPNCPFILNETDVEFVEKNQKENSSGDHNIYEFYLDGVKYQFETGKKVEWGIVIVNWSNASVATERHPVN